MQIVLPDVNHILHGLINVESTFDGKKQRIDLWVVEHRTVINKNKRLIEQPTYRTG